MEEERVIYHTVEDRGNPDYVLQNAPFMGNVESSGNQWLGNGYYFWDSLIIWAHWWGERHYNNKYIICSSSMPRFSNDVLDLTDPNECIKLAEWAEYIKKKDKTEKKLGLSRLMQILEKKNILKNFKAIKANFNKKICINSNYHKTITSLRAYPGRGDDDYLDLCPHVQICVRDKSILTKPISIIYPLEYCDGYEDNILG